MIAEEPMLYTDAELCRLLRVSRVSTFRLRRSGALKFLKLKGGIRYTVAHVADFIRSREQDAAQPANDGRAEQ